MLTTYADTFRQAGQIFAGYVHVEQLTLVTRRVFQASQIFVGKAW
jgi:hypothetical protein